MEYTTLGRTELKVSVAGLGCGGFSRLGLNTGGTEASAIAIIHAALDHGVNLLDTAAPYDTEGVVGKAIKRVPRERVVIATKASVFRGGERYAPEHVVASLDNSLRELGIDCIDVFQLHAVPPSGYDYVRDVIAPALLKREGARQVPLPRHHRDLAQRSRTPDAAARRSRRAVGRGDGGVPPDEPEHARGGVPGDAADIASARC